MFRPISLLFVFCSTVVLAKGESHGFQYGLDPNIGESQSFYTFSQVLKNSQAASISEFLQEWKVQDPILFRFYLVAYRSRSLQEASPEFPRVVVFHPIGDFMASFNGHPAQRGYQNLEVIRFDHKKDRFDFFEVTFADGEKPHISEANPKKCLDCHQSLARGSADARPNWEPYFSWPGFLGTASGKLYTSVSQLSGNELRKFDPVDDAIILQDIGNEYVWNARFRDELRPAHDRYQFLDIHSYESGKQDAQLYSGYANQENKNLLFTQRVAQLNFRRVARLMSEDKELFDYLKEAVVALIDCDVEILPDPFFQWLKQNSSLKNKDFKLQNQKYQVNLGDRIRLLFEPFYFETDDWSMDFKTNGKYAFSSRFGTPGIATEELLYAIGRVSPEVNELRHKSCLDSVFLQKLKKYKNFETALELQKKRAPQKEVIEKLKNRPLLSRCVSCHQEPTNNSIPFIPFGDAQALRLALPKKGYKRGTLLSEIFYRIGPHALSNEQMPPRGIPTEEQREELVQFLEGL